MKQLPRVGSDRLWITNVCRTQKTSPVMTGGSRARNCQQFGYTSSVFDVILPVFSRSRIYITHSYRQAEKYFRNLVRSTGIILYLIFSDWFGTKWKSVWYFFSVWWFVFWEYHTGLWALKSPWLCCHHRCLRQVKSSWAWRWVDKRSIKWAEDVVNVDLVYQQPCVCIQYLQDILNILRSHHFYLAYEHPYMLAFKNCKVTWAYWKFIISFLRINIKQPCVCITFRAAWTY